jgi:hypothetical protein
MKRTLLFCVLIVFFTISFVSLVGCDSFDQKKKLKEEYELQEKCSKRCEGWFKKEYEGQKCFYKNHYNRKMNKCLILIYCNEGEVSNELLFDVNEHNRIGGFSYFTEGSVMCSMLGKECKSKSEWEKLVKPYMEE